MCTFYLADVLVAIYKLFTLAPPCSRKAGDPTELRIEQSRHQSVGIRDAHFGLLFCASTKSMNGIADFYYCAPARDRVHFLLNRWLSAHLHLLQTGFVLVKSSVRFIDSLCWTRGPVLLFIFILFNTCLIYLPAIFPFLFLN